MIKFEKISILIYCIHYSILTNYIYEKIRECYLLFFGFLISIFVLIHHNLAIETEKHQSL